MLNRHTLFGSSHRIILTVIIGLLALRLVGLFFSPLGLHGDEAQYWYWSKDLDWGYFSKPPMIAWLIAMTTSVFGDVEWAVRLSSPIIHALTSYVIYRTARFAYSEKTGIWAAIIYYTMPGVWLSSGIISTDVALLLFWAIALNAWLHLRETPTWPRALQLGVAVGLGILCKYAMFFFLPALGLAFLFDKPSRKALNSIKGYTAGVLTLAIVTPNILWNMRNDFATLTHTVANANLQKDIPFHPDELLTFWVDQLGVFGPITFPLMIIAAIAALRGRLRPPSRFLALFILSPLIIISLEAILSRANANWAVTAYVAAPIILAHYIVEKYETIRRWAQSGVALNIVAGIVIVTLGLSPKLADTLGAANSFKRLRAWPETVEYIKSRYEAGHEGAAFSAIGADKRIVYYSLTYYGLGDKIPLKMWMYKSHPENHAELKQPLPAQKGPVLILNYYDSYEDELRQDFETLVPLPPLDIDLGGGKRRKLKLWAGYGYTPTTTR